MFLAVDVSHVHSRIVQAQHCRLIALPPVQVLLVPVSVWHGYYCVQRWSYGRR
eukprot:SAG22_NODE_901_length_6600_cov_1.945854_8_plen_53_part_00